MNIKKKGIAGCWKWATGHIFSKKFEMLFSERHESRFLIDPNTIFLFPVGLCTDSLALMVYSPKVVISEVSDNGKIPF